MKKTICEQQLTSAQVNISLRWPLMLMIVYTLYALAYSSMLYAKYYLLKHCSNKKDSLVIHSVSMPFGTDNFDT